LLDALHAYLALTYRAFGPNTIAKEEADKHLLIKAPQSTNLKSSSSNLFRTYIAVTPERIAKIPLVLSPQPGWSANFIQKTSGTMAPTLVGVEKDDLIIPVGSIPIIQTHSCLIWYVIGY
jgi:hypothetical protein